MLSTILNEFLDVYIFNVLSIAVSFLGSNCSVFGHWEPFRLASVSFGFDLCVMCFTVSPNFLLLSVLNINVERIVHEHPYALLQASTVVSILPVYIYILMVTPCTFILP